jgi:hypothetical protein
MLPAMSRGTTFSDISPLGAVAIVLFLVAAAFFVLFGVIFPAAAPEKARSPPEKQRFPPRTAGPAGFSERISEFLVQAIDFRTETVKLEVISRGSPTLQGIANASNEGLISRQRKLL